MKTRFAKFLALALAMLMIVSAFAGCGKNETPETPDNPDKDNEQNVNVNEDDGKIIITDTFYPQYHKTSQYAKMRAELEKWVREQLEGGSIFSAGLQEVAALGGNNVSNLEVSFDDLKKRWTASEVTETEENGNKVLKKTYTDSASSLVFTTTVILYGDVPTADIKTVVENVSDKRSPVIRDFYAIDSKYPLAKGSGPIKLTTLIGSFADATDFDLVERNLTKSFVEQKKDAPGNIKVTNQNTVFCPTGESDGIGFSSSGYGFPYFDLIGDDKGIMMAIGWSGQWEGRFRKDGEGNAVIMAGQQNLSTFLEPGESIEAPRIVLTYFEGDREYGHNIWREMMFSHYTPDNDNDSTNANNFVSPIAVNFWGGTYAETVKTSFNNYIKAGAAIDLLWFDAGWSSNLIYSSKAAFNTDKAGDAARWKTFIAGNPTTTFNNATSPNAKYPAWVEFMGDYIENDFLFPNGLEEIGKFVDDTNAANNTKFRFMVWWMIFDRRLSHSEYPNPAGGIAESAGPTKTNILTQEEISQYKDKYPNLDNLIDSDYLVKSNPAANELAYGSRLDMSKDSVLNKLIDYYKYMYDVKGVDCVRLDNCNAPLKNWLFTDIQYQLVNTDVDVKNENDSNFYRQGYTENKWTTNEYKLWDALRAYNPDFFLDNTASGGRRLDIELVRRSVSLWRTDFNNPGDSASFYEAHQKMTQNLALWVPLTAAGYPVGSSQYNARCLYSSSASIQGPSGFDTESESFDKIVGLTQEFAQLRPYWYGSYYQLLEVKADNKAWQAYQLYREDWQEGMLVVSRGLSSMIMRQTVKLAGLMEDREYTLHNIDDEGTEKDIVKTGKELMEEGINFTQDAGKVNTYIISLNRIDTDEIR